MNIKDEIKIFNEQRATKEKKFKQQQAADAKGLIKTLLEGLRPKFVELAELIKEVKPDIRAKILADKSVHKAVKSFSVETSSSDGGKRPRFTDEEILNAIEPKMTRKMLQVKLKTSFQTVKKRVEALIKAGKVNEDKKTKVLAKV